MNIRRHGQAHERSLNVMVPLSHRGSITIGPLRSSFFNQHQYLHLHLSLSGVQGAFLTALVGTGL